MTIHQWVPAAHQGDAIGDSARRLRGLLRRLGHQSEIFALTVDDGLKGEVRPFTSADASGGDLTLFHFALPSPMTEAFGQLKRGRVLIYHNVTPARFFAPYDATLFRLASIARRELSTLVGRAELALGVSDYNRRELENLGFSNTGVLPLAVDLERLTTAARRPALDRSLDDDFVNFLFVGRVAPNKMVEDIIRLAEHYKRYVDAYYRFIFVGKHNAVPRYWDTLRALMSEYRFLNERFVFTGPVPDEDLATYYRHAAVYISMSEHEGFCAPLLEAMAMNVPILAYSAAAVPETLGGAGVQFFEKDMEYTAELLGVLAFDDAVRTRVIAEQHTRLQHFSEERLTEGLRHVVWRATENRHGIPS